jgi:hypothetical protein
MSLCGLYTDFRQFFPLHYKATLRTYDFLGLRMAVATSLGPGPGGAPLGSAIMFSQAYREG